MKRGACLNPNILLIMADQFQADCLGCYGHPVVQSPNIDGISRNGVVFDSCYSPSPLCAPSRASLFSGLLPNGNGVYDNGAEFLASIPTLVHYLRVNGYRTVASGKLHFIGPDQLHGFEYRLTTDIYPAGFDYIPGDWIDGIQRSRGASVGVLKESGICRRSLQMDYDDLAHFRALEALYEIARFGSGQPFFMTVSYTHPHDPFYITAPYWFRYSNGDIALPQVTSEMVVEHPYDKWLNYHHSIDVLPPTPDDILRSRHAYYGMISYIDDKVGELIDVLRQTDQLENTIVVFTADHGEMLGERGMWFKRSMYEMSTRVPLIISWPLEFPSHRVSVPVSLLDLFPTMVSLLGNKLNVPLDGSDLRSFLCGNATAHRPPVISEYLGEGIEQPVRMVREGSLKFVYVHGQAEQLYDLDVDPNELSNIANDKSMMDKRSHLRSVALSNWNPEEQKRLVIKSQTDRRFLRKVHREGQSVTWDFEPDCQERFRFVRGQPTQAANEQQRL